MFGSSSGFSCSPKDVSGRGFGEADECSLGSNRKKHRNQMSLAYLY